MDQQFPRLILPVAHLTQRRIGDCLVACAGMLLSYHRKSFDYHRVARQLNTQDFGTVFSHMRNLKVKDATVSIVHGDLDHLYKCLQQNQPPAVAVNTAELPHWYNRPGDVEEVGHAVVVVGMDSEMIYVNDPAFINAPLRVPLGEFQLSRIDFDEIYAVLI